MIPLYFFSFYSRKTKTIKNAYKNFQYKKCYCKNTTHHFISNVRTHHGRFSSGVCHLLGPYVQDYISRLVLVLATC